MGLVFQTLYLSHCEDSLQIPHIMKHIGMNMLQINTNFVPFFVTCILARYIYGFSIHSALGLALFYSPSTYDR